jgi:aspartyl-tRNA(Asn)/glutamyl-tRNA(Gln) amidotransferase subunit A
MEMLREAAARLAGGTTSRALVEDCLARIEHPQGEGRRAFLKIAAATARAGADYVDRLRAHSAAPTPYAGIPISIKDLFDIAGDVTTAGSVVLKEAPPARRDAIAVARLKAAGFVVIGRTNMTEFAFSGLGLNPHFGTPLSPYDRATGRIPGGSSAGAAVSVADRMAFAALGTDTGGSCRIPAAFCGIVGFKPTARRVPLGGTFPLSPSLDSVGPLAPSVECCATLDAVLAGAEPAALPELPLAGLRLAVPQTMVLADLDAHVARAFAAALSALSEAGAHIADIALSELQGLAKVNRKGGIATAEAYAFHRALMAERAAQFDRRVLTRILRGKEIDAADFIDLQHARADMIASVAAATAPYDALLMPTTPVIPPVLREIEEDDQRFHVVNLLCLRNTAIVNALDRCAISLPCHRAGDAPVGLMVVGEHGTDRRLLALAAAIERIVSPPLAARAAWN